MSQTKTPHAILILYDGHDISEENFAHIAAGIANLLFNANVTTPELTTIVYRDTKELTNLVLKETAGTAKKTKNGKDKKDDPVENALKYLSVRYKTFLANRDTLPLAFQLSQDIKNSDDTALLNALKIVCEDETVYEPQLKKYGISRDALNTIQKWYCMSVYGN